MRPADAFAERLGLPVQDRELLDQALVHSSWLHEHPDPARGHNERLELLGDAVVNLADLRGALHAPSRDDEGLLSARRAAIVSTPGLARLAARLDLGSYLLLGEGEALRGGRRRPSLLASSFEALCGRALPGPRLAGRPATGSWRLPRRSYPRTAPVTTLKSPKSRLQEHTQRSTGDRPVYHLLEASGPDHEKHFRIEVAVDGRVLGAGEGPSRRLAETAAAAEALEVIRRERRGARGPRGGSNGSAACRRRGGGRRSRRGRRR